MARAAVHPREWSHRHVDELADAGELRDLRQAALHLGPGQPEHHPVDHRVVAAGDLRMEPGAQLDQGGHAAVRRDGPRGRSQDAGDQLEERRLARPVGTDHPDGLAACHLEVDPLEGEETVLSARPQLAAQQRALNECRRPRRDGGR
jgi:hypothetical protein